MPPLASCSTVAMMVPPSVSFVEMHVPVSSWASTGKQDLDVGLRRQPGTPRTIMVDENEDDDVQTTTRKGDEESERAEDVIRRVACQPLRSILRAWSEIVGRGEGGRDERQSSLGKGGGGNLERAAGRGGGTIFEGVL